MQADAPALDPEAAREATASAAAANHAVGALHLWERFHVRLSMLYGVMVFLVLTGMGAAFYLRGVDAEIQGLQLRMRAMAVTLASGLPAEDVVAVNSEADREGREYQAFVSLFARIAEDEPLIQSIYILRPTEREGWLRFSADWVRNGRAPAAPGEDYDARQAHAMLEGLQNPSFEEEPYTDDWGTVMSGYAPVRDASGRSVAVVGVDVKIESVEAMKRDVRLLTLGLYGIAALLLVGLTLAVGRMIRGPLSRIITATSAIAGGRLDVRASLDRPDEFGILGRHFDQMALGLQEREFIRATFGRYVSEEVARKILASGKAQLAGEERIVSVLITDLENYSAISEHLPPAEVVRLLNAYMSAMGDLIDAHGGCVIEYLGDAILCVFGAPGDLPNHAEQATRCGIAMVRRLADLNREWEAQGLAKLWTDRGYATLGVRMGVHTGRVVAGNVGSRSRVKYAVVGDAVNVAARVEALNKVIGTQLLVTGDTVDRLPADLRALAIDKGEHAVKGRRQPIRAWTF